jgi:hypothetical protein
MRCVWSVSPWQKRVANRRQSRGLTYNTPSEQLRWETPPDKIPRSTTAFSTFFPCNNPLGVSFMTSSSMVTFALRSALTLVGGLALTDCVVSGTARPPVYTVQTQQPSYSVQTQQPVYQQPQPVYQQPQPVYQQPVAQPVYQQPVAQPVYQAPPSVGVGVGVSAGVSVGGGMVVGNNWVTNGYAENDFISYNMSMRARQFASGMVPATQLFRAAMGQGQRQFVTVQIAPGRCYRIVGVGGPGVQDLDLRMRDANGNVVDQDVATDNFPVLGLNRQLCPTWAGTFQVEIIMYSGGGDIGVQAFATN